MIGGHPAGFTENGLYFTHAPQQLTWLSSFVSDKPLSISLEDAAGEPRLRLVIEETTATQLEILMINIVCKTVKKTRILQVAWLTGLAILLLSPTVNAQQPDAEALAEKMLDRLGGRTVWAELRNTVNGSQQNRADEPTVVYAVITMDFERPRFRIETTAQDLHLIRVIDGKNSWRLRGSGKIEDVPESLFNDDMNWYASHLYRTIHRVAARDPSLSLNIGIDGRLVISSNDRRIFWLKLDAKGEPFAFGALDDDVGSLSGPWDVVKDGIHHPRWISSSDGTWRAAVKALDVNVPLHSSTFARPKNN